MRKIKRKIGCILLLLLLIGVGYIYKVGFKIPEGLFFTTHEFRDIKVPGEHINTYLKIAKKYKISWEYLAAIDEVKSNYKNVTANNIELHAKNISKGLGNRVEIADNVEKILLKNYTQSETSKIMLIAKDYQWEAAPISRKYLFPFLKHDRSKVSYSDSWGSSRSYGGRRKHEGVDLMSPYGTPIIAVTDGTIVSKGWHELGGWKISIQDKEYPHIFHYYAHLSKYQSGIELGTVVSKGQIIGFVGDSGYGPEGTTGQFPPHLHYGIYILSNFKTSAVNPFAFLKAWDNGV